MPIERMNPAGAPRRLGLSHLVRAGDTAYIASQASLDSDFTLIGPADPEAQTAEIYRHIELCARAAGGTLHDLVSITNLIAAPQFLPVVERAGEAQLGPRPAARTVVVLPIHSFPGLLHAAFATQAVGAAAGRQECFNPPGLMTPRGYSHAVRIGNVVHVSGQFPYDADGRLVGPAEPEAQARQAFGNLETCLRAAGAGPGEVLRMGVFTTHPAYLDAIARVGADFYGDAPPAGSAVIALLPDPHALLEIEAIAVLGEPRRCLNPDGVYRPQGFSAIALAGGMACISVQAAVDDAGAPVALGDVDRQLARIYARLDAALAAVGAARESIVRAPMYYLRPEYYRGVIRAREDYWGPNLPTPPSMPVLGLPDPRWMVGIEATAILDMG
jgi:enamine deaminase RidA (YjgF/YER057c/UK114 family)